MSDRITELKPTHHENLWKPNEAETLESNIFQALGAASMCWQYPGGGGIFDSTRAKAIGELLTAYINRHDEIMVQDADSKVRRVQGERDIARVDCQRLMNEINVRRSESEALHSQVRAMQERTIDDQRLIESFRHERNRLGDRINQLTDERDRLEQNLHAFKEIQEEYARTLDGIIRVNGEEPVNEEANYVAEPELVERMRQERDEWQRMALAACQSVLDVLKSKYHEAMRS